MSASPIAAMFDRISPHYDRLNHLLSLNIDKVWRRKAAKQIARHHPTSILDLATGTADLAILLAKKSPQSHIVGADISEQMLEIGKAKIEKQGLENQIELMRADASNLPFRDNSFNAVTCAFGVRNFEHRDKGLAEICRVMKAGGHIAILEFSMPERFPVKQLYRFYFKHILPKIGGIVSNDAAAYAYLPKSVERFPNPKDFIHDLQSKGLRNNTMKRLFFGIATLYMAQKP